MSLIVQKFGGSSVRDRAHMLRACTIIRDTHAQGHQVVAVFSAQGDTTDELLRAAHALSLAPSARELDALLATGESASVALGAIALHSLGVPAVSLSAWQAGVETDDIHSAATVKNIASARILRELDAGKVVLVAGFQGVDAHGDLTTLGRGGSDTSAVALAAFLGAERCEIYTDVDGVFTTDPRVCAQARRLDAVSYDDMLCLARCGAQVLHDKSVALAKRHGVTLSVLSCEKNAVGTRIVEHTDIGITGITRRALTGETSAITLVGAAVPSEHCRALALAALRKAGIEALDIEDGEAALHITVPREREREALCALHAAFFEGGVQAATTQKDG